jgi:hypothetical protein
MRRAKGISTERGAPWAVIADAEEGDARSSVCARQ